jgi:teichoic acid transport system permease protein
VTAAPPADGEASALAEQYGLQPLGGRPKLGEYLAELWQRRHFALELARSRFKAENEADRLGAAWIVLRPLINAAVYGLVFGVILLGSSRPQDYLPFLVSGVFLFQFWAGCLTDGARAVVNNMGLVTTLHFPRAVLPIAVIYQQVLGLLWMVVALLGIVVLNGDLPRLSWPLLIPVLVLMSLFNLGMAFVAARMTIHLRDIAQLIPFISRMFFYLSGIFVSLAKLAGVDKTGHIKHLTAYYIMEANPLYVFITLARVALLGPREDIVGHVYSATRMWGYGIAWGVGLLVVGFLFFWRAEDEYGRE